MTRPRSDVRPVIALGAAVALVVVLALVTVGGPGQGRAERRDAARYGDLMALQGQVKCLADAAGGTLPETLAESLLCHMAERYADPYSGAPYRYERVSETAYQLCAAFDLPERVQDFGGSFDRTTGCLAATLGD